ncbi:MAG: hypothetical protein JKY17_02330 [Magnetovibrio sp.]|nr:hypothetical protein [Magnetovibrio sp.]
MCEIIAYQLDQEVSTVLSSDIEIGESDFGGKRISWMKISSAPHINLTKAFKGV